MNKPFKPAECRRCKWPLQLEYENGHAFCSSCGHESYILGTEPWRMKQVNALADKLIRQMRAGEYQAPSRLLLHPVDDVQFDTDRDRDEQGLAVGEKP